MAATLERRQQRCAVATLRYRLRQTSIFYSEFDSYPCYNLQATAVHLPVTRYCTAVAIIRMVRDVVDFLHLLTLPGVTRVSVHSISRQSVSRVCVTQTTLSAGGTATLVSSLLSGLHTGYRILILIPYSFIVTAAHQNCGLWTVRSVD